MMYGFDARTKLYQRKNWEKWIKNEHTLSPLLLIRSLGF